MADLSPEIAKKISDQVAKTVIAQQQLNAAGVDYTKILEGQSEVIGKISGNLKGFGKIRKEDYRALERIRKAEALRGRNVNTIRKGLEKLSKTERDAVKKYMKLNNERFLQEKDNAQKKLRMVEKDISKEMSMLEKMNKEKESLVKE